MHLLSHVCLSMPKSQFRRQNDFLGGKFAPGAPFDFGGVRNAQDAYNASKKTSNADNTMRKASSTLRSSRAVPHPSTNRALRRLTSEFGRDPVHSTRYGRWRRIMHSTKKDLMMLQLRLRLQTNLLHSGLIRRKLKKACVTASARVWYLQPKWLR